MAVYPGLKGVVLDWHDGDTGHIDVQLPFGLWLRSYDISGHPLWSCRLQGVPRPGVFQEVDSPELSTKNVPNPAGDAAREAILQFCPAGTLVTVDSVDWAQNGGGWDFDKYGGRWDAVVTLPDGSDLGNKMVEGGFATWVAS